MAKVMCSPVLKRGRASLVQVCTLSFISFLCPHPQPTAMSTTCLASNTVHQEAQTDGLTQTHFNGRILKGCLVGHIKKKIKRCHKHSDFCLIFYYCNYLFFGHAGCGILVPRPGVESMPPAVEAWSPNHCTAREIPGFLSYK